MEDLNSVLRYAKSKNYPVHNPRGLYVEYLQCEMLRSIFRHTTKLSFIGGTALRVVFHTQRFSEDLDFDNFGLSVPNSDYLNQKAGIASFPELKKKLLARCAEINFEEMAKDVAPFLFDASDAIRIIKFKQYIEQWDVSSK